jgi:hypothetical protein
MRGSILSLCVAVGDFRLRGVREGFDPRRRNSGGNRAFMPPKYGIGVRAISSTRATYRYELRNPPSARHQQKTQPQPAYVSRLCTRRFPKMLLVAGNRVSAYPSQVGIFSSPRAMMSHNLSLRNQLHSVSEALPPTFRHAKIPRWPQEGHKARIVGMGLENARGTSALLSWGSLVRIQPGSPIFSKA